MLLFGAGNCHACSLRPNSQVDLRCRRHRFLETLYLTYLKLTGADAFCPVGGGSCSKILDSDYAVVFAFLSFTLFYVTVKDIGLQEVSKQLGMQLLVASLVILSLNTSYSNSKSASSSLAENDLPYFATEITTPLSPFALSLAWHLHCIGAKMYGAFWCLHCQEQKEIKKLRSKKSIVEMKFNGKAKGQWNRGQKLMMNGSKKT
ncbi:hypothetical protein GLYMA_01G161400v4 [Glycine max]|nr:hypothetical protein GLYMA_01G161400v4 [Glycine max]KAH1163388.1 hypothetical protein GYH30_001762 [Glycine max]